MNVKHKAILALLFVLPEIALWSVILQIGGKSIGLVPLLFYGFLLGSITSLIMSFLHDRGNGIRAMFANPGLLAMILIAGLLNDVLTQLFLGTGTLGTNASVGGIVFRSWILIVALLTPFIVKQKVGRIQMLATLIGFSGIYLLLSGGSLLSLNSSQAFYVGMLLLAALCTALSILIMSRYSVDTTSAVVFYNIASFVVISLLAGSSSASLAVNFTPTIVFTVLFLGIPAFVLGTTLYYYSLKILGPMTMGNIGVSVPFLTIIFSFLILGTPIKSYYVLSALLISAGILLQRHYSILPERVTSRKTLRQTPIFDITSAFAENNGVGIGNSIKNGGRVLAIRLDAEGFNENAHAPIFTRHNCIAFTNTLPHAEAKGEEIAFVGEIMGLAENELALIGVGNPNNLEEAFEEYKGAYV